MGIRTMAVALAVAVAAPGLAMADTLEKTSPKEHMAAAC